MRVLPHQASCCYSTGHSPASAARAERSPRPSHSFGVIRPFPRGRPSMANSSLFSGSKAHVPSSGVGMLVIAASSLAMIVFVKWFLRPYSQQTRWDAARRTGSDHSCCSRTDLRRAPASAAASRAGALSISSPQARNPKKKKLCRCVSEARIDCVRRTAMAVPGIVSHRSVSQS